MADNKQFGPVKPQQTTASDIRSVIKNATTKTGKGLTIANRDEIIEQKEQPKTPSVNSLPVNNKLQEGGLNNVAIKTLIKQNGAIGDQAPTLSSTPSVVKPQQPTVESNLAPVKPGVNITNIPIKSVNNQKLTPDTYTFDKNKYQNKLVETDGERNSRQSKGIENIYIDAYNKSVDGTTLTIQDVMGNPNYQSQLKGIDQNKIQELVDDANILAQGDFDKTNILYLLDKHNDLGVTIDFDSLDAKTKGEFLNAMMGEGDGSRGIWDYVSVVDKFTPINAVDTYVLGGKGDQFFDWLGEKGKNMKHDMLTQSEVDEIAKDDIAKLDEAYSKYYTKDNNGEKDWNSFTKHSEYNRQLAKIRKAVEDAHGDSGIVGTANFLKNHFANGLEALSQGWNLVKNPMSMLSGLTSSLVGGVEELAGVGMDIGEFAKTGKWEHKDVKQRIAEYLGYDNYKDALDFVQYRMKDTPMNNVLGAIMKQIDVDTNTAAMMYDYAKENYGSFDNFINAWGERPLEVYSDLATAGQGIVSLLKRAGLVNPLVADRTIDTLGKFDTYEQMIKAGNKANAITAKLVLKGGKGAIGGLTKGVSKGTKYAIDTFLNNVTGINKEERDFIKNNPEDVDKFLKGEENSQTILDRIKDKFDTTKEEGKQLGEEYNIIKNSDTPIQSEKMINEIKDALWKGGVHLTDKGVELSKNYGGSVNNKLKELASFINEYEKKDYKTAEDTHRLRMQADTLSKWEGQLKGTEATAVNLIREVRDIINKELKNQVPGMKELDTKYVQYLNTVKELKKDWFNSDGTLKDSAYSKIRNITNKGTNQPKLERLEKNIPGITKDLKALAVAESIEKAGKVMVGQYANKIGNLLGWGTLMSLLTGGTALMPLLTSILGITLTTPKNMAKVLKYQGKAERWMKGVIDKLMGGKKLTAEETMQLTKYLNDNEEIIKETAAYLKEKGLLDQQYKEGKISKEEYTAKRGDLEYYYAQDKAKKIDNTNGEKLTVKDANKIKDIINNHANNPGYVMRFLNEKGMMDALIKEGEVPQKGIEGFKGVMEKYLNIMEHPTDTTQQHEFFHSVFEVVDNKTKNYLLQEAKKILKDEGIGDVAAEERLAETFGIYAKKKMIDTGIIKASKAGKFMKTLKSFFQKVLNWLGDFNKDRDTLVEIFDNIYEGKTKIKDGTLDLSYLLKEDKKLGIKDTKLDTKEVKAEVKPKTLEKKPESKPKTLEKKAESKPIEKKEKPLEVKKATRREILGDKFYSQLEKNVELINKSREGIKDPITVEDLDLSSELYEKEFNKIADAEMKEIQDEYSKIQAEHDNMYPQAKKARKLSEEQQNQLDNAPSQEARNELLDKWRKEYYEKYPLTDEQLKKVEELVNKGTEMANRHGKARQYLLEQQKNRYDGLRYKSVYHGSHADFDKFDSSHMGEGEGAQAHGWGHYVAVDNKIAHEYAQVSSTLKGNKSENTYKGKPESSFKTGLEFANQSSEDVAAQLVLGQMSLYGDGLKQAKEGAKELINDKIREYDKLLRGDLGFLEKDRGSLEKAYKKYQEAYDKIDGLKEKDFGKNYANNVYDLEIPDPKKAKTPTGKNYLEEDKVITGPQYEKIHKALAEYDPSIKDDYQQNLPYYNWRKTTGYGNGKELYEQISGILGSDKAASKFLESLGYDGIHYFGEQDGEAYVIFNDDSLQIKDHIRYKKKTEYEKAVESGDKEKALGLLRKAAAEKGYNSSSDYQGSKAFNGSAPSSEGLTKAERINPDTEMYSQTLGDYASDGVDIGDLDWQLTDRGNYIRGDEYVRESIDNLNKAVREYKAGNKNAKIKMYRAIDADIKENGFRNGDWITPSKKYAEMHIGLQDWNKGRIIEEEVPIENIWWDNNDINERGYDDGKEYGYKNTPNNKKELGITYDDKGKLIPLEKRFDEKNPDIRYKKDTKGLQEKDKLIGLHNLNINKLKGAIELGGMPMPSIAVTKKGVPHESYGDITFIMKESAINPALSRKNRLYTVDGYTPTAPQTITKVKDTKEANALMDKIQKETGIGYGELMQWLEYHDDRYFKDYPKLKEFDKYYDQLTEKKLWGGYTPSGKRKYIDYNLDNLVKQMTGNKRNAFNGSYWKMVAQSQGTATIDKLRERKYGLKNEEAANQLHSKYFDAIGDLYEKVGGGQGAESLSDYGRFADEIADTYSPSTDAWFKEITQWEGVEDTIYAKIKKEDLQKLQDIIKEGAELARPYSEAKPERAIRFDEVGAVVAPEGKLKEVKDMLKDTGLKVYGYKEGERMSVVDKVADDNGLRFKKSQTDTPEFKKWFEGSKVVDKEGNPEVVYRGSPEKLGYTFEYGKNYYGGNKGFWFTNQENIAKDYSFNRVTGENGEVKAVYLDIKNPLDLTPLKYNTTSKKFNDFIRDNYGVDLGRGSNKEYQVKELYEKNQNILYSLGKYDGIKLNDEGITWIAKTPTQIKSATDNIGTFDKNNPDIRYKKSKENGLEGKNEVRYKVIKGTDAEMRSNLGKILRMIRNDAIAGGLTVSKYTKNGPLENALNTMWNINNKKGYIQNRDIYEGVVGNKLEGMMQLANIIDGGNNIEDLHYKWYYDPAEKDKKYRTTLIFWKGDTLSDNNYWAVHLPKTNQTKSSIAKFRKPDGKLENTPLRHRHRKVPVGDSEL